MLENQNYCALIPTPFCTLGVKTKAESIERIDLIDQELDDPIYHSNFSERISLEIQKYISNPQYQMSLPLMNKGTLFQRSVWNQINNISSGSCATYGQIATTLESGARAVANACRRNPYPIVVPCHRVVGKQSLGGYAGETIGFLFEAKKWLLNHEACQCVSSNN